MTRKFKLELADEDVGGADEAVRPEPDGYVDYDAFAHWLSAADDIAQIEKKVQHYAPSSQGRARPARRGQLVRRGRDDRLSRSDLRHTLESRPHALDAQVGALIDKRGRDRSGTIERPSAPEDGERARQGDGTPRAKAGAHDVTQLASELRAKLKRLGDQHKHKGGLEQVFRKLDVDGSGALGSTSSTARSRISTSRSRPRRTTLLECFDTDASNSIGWEEFIHFIKNPPEGDEIGVIMSRIREHVFVNDVKDFREDARRLATTSTARAS